MEDCELQIGEKKMECNEISKGVHYSMVDWFSAI